MRVTAWRGAARRGSARVTGEIRGEKGGRDDDAARRGEAGRGEAGGEKAEGNGGDEGRREGERVEGR